MLILLPPSETKFRPRRGAPLRLESVSFPELTALRAEIIDAVVTASARPDALHLLDVPATLQDEVDANLSLTTRPTRPALEIYTGVLYDALAATTLSPAGKRRAARRICAGWGAWPPGGRSASMRSWLPLRAPGSSSTVALRRMPRRGRLVATSPIVG